MPVNTAATGNSARRHWALSVPSLAGAAIVLAIVAGIVVYAVLEGDFAESVLDLRHWTGGIVRHFGAAGSLGLLYAEESGVPMPVPGDVYVTYLGHLSAGSAAGLLGAWLAIIAVVTAGASNLYWVSRRWGHHLIAHPLAHVLHLDARRLARAERWFDHWGVLAMIFGRHIPGFRVPLTLVAGVLRFPYRVFAPSVALSTGIWAAVFLMLGERFGRQMAHFLAGHAWVYGAGTLVVVGFVAIMLLRALRPARG